MCCSDWIKDLIEGRYNQNFRVTKISQGSLSKEKSGSIQLVTLSLDALAAGSHNILTELIEDIRGDMGIDHLKKRKNIIR